MKRKGKGRQWGEREGKDRKGQERPGKDREGMQFFKKRKHSAQNGMIVVSVSFSLFLNIKQRRAKIFLTFLIRSIIF